MNHLEYYKECVETGLLRGENYCLGGTHRNGLCHELGIDKELLILFRPTDYLHEDDRYWAGNGNPGENGEKFNTLRQNIVLFIAAMRGEL